MIRKNHEKKLELTRRLASLRRDNEATINDEPPEIVGEVEQLKLQEKKLLQARNVSQEGPVMQQIRSYKDLETKRDVEHPVEF